MPARDIAALAVLRAWCIVVAGQTFLLGLLSAIANRDSSQRRLCAITSTAIVVPRAADLTLL
ncbi:MAG: hypothetical protein ACK5JT_18680 [Hyphomicrobiaceae bacterium]